MPKYFAPYPRFRAVVNGRVVYFHRGYRIVDDNDKKLLALIKKIPIELGEIKDADGNVVNAPPKPKVKKGAKPKKAAPAKP